MLPRHNEEDPFVRDFPIYLWIVICLILLVVVVAAFTISGCAYAKPAPDGCGDNHPPVAKIQVRQ